MIQIKRLVLGPFQQNTRIIFNEESKECLVVDPGDQPQKIENFISSNKLKLQAILLTHAHIDHVGAVEKLREGGVKVYMHEADLPLYEEVDQQAKMFGISIKKPSSPDIYIHDREVLELIGIELLVLHTPGHSPGGLCFYIAKPKPIVLVGDTLFQGSIGRTDLWGGNHRQLIKSIKEQLFTLPDNTIVMSGHGPDSVIKTEKDTNPFLV